MVLQIESRRKAAGITQIQLAAHMGVTQGVVSNWEHEVILPRPRDLPRLLVFFYFLYGDMQRGDENHPGQGDEQSRRAGDELAHGALPQSVHALRVQEFPGGVLQSLELFAQEALCLRLVLAGDTQKAVEVIALIAVSAGLYPPESLPAVQRFVQIKVRLMQNNIPAGYTVVH